MASEGVNFTQFNLAIWSSQGAGGGFWNSIINFFVVRSISATGEVIVFSTPGAFITAAYPVLLSLAGLILFVMIIWGGFEILMGASDPKSAESGKKRITNALIGFFILFAAFWIGQILQVVFGINIGI